MTSEENGRKREHSGSARQLMVPAPPSGARRQPVAVVADPHDVGVGAWVDVAAPHAAALICRRLAEGAVVKVWPLVHEDPIRADARLSPELGGNARDGDTSAEAADELLERLGHGAATSNTSNKSSWLGFPVWTNVQLTRCARPSKMQACLCTPAPPSPKSITQRFLVREFSKGCTSSATQLNCAISCALRATKMFPRLADMKLCVHAVAKHVRLRNEMTK